MARKLYFLLILLTLLLPAGASRAADASTSILALTPAWTSDGVGDGVDYGISVASAGDINQDGYPDVIVGAQKFLIDGLRTGAAFVFLGGPAGLSSVYHRRLSTLDAGSYFGGAVSGAGDVNGDGYADVIVGAPNYHEATGNEGAAYLYLGSKDGLSAVPAWSKSIPVADAQFGSAVSGAGDVNKDGYADVLVGARTFKDGQTTEGAVFLFLGSPSGLAADPVWSFQSDQPAAQLGLAVTGGCDLNLDGYADVVVSAPYYDQGEADAGMVWVFLGAPSGLSGLPVWSAAGEQADARFGSALSCAGDVDRNGYPDLLVGARGYDGVLPDSSVALDAGAAFLFYNTDGILASTAGWQVYGDQAYAGLGISASLMGDADEDGYPDVAVGAYKYTVDQSEEGAVFVYKGGPSGAAPLPCTMVAGNKSDTYFGYAIAGAGDVNRDGNADLLVGAPNYKKADVRVGRALLYKGVVAGEAVEMHSVYLPLVISK